MANATALTALPQASNDSKFSIMSKINILKHLKYICLMNMKLFIKKHESVLKIKFEKKVVKTT